MHSPSDCGSPSQEFSPGDPLECLTLDLASTKNVSQFGVRSRLCFLALRIVATHVKFKWVTTEASTGWNSFRAEGDELSLSIKMFCDSFAHFLVLGLVL